MKRSVTVLALLMLLFAFLGGQAFTADINDYGLVEDNHPWEDGQDGNGQGNCNHTVGSLFSFTATSSFPLDILANRDLFVIEFKRLLLDSDRSNTTLTEEKDLYIDRTRQASFK